MVIHFDRHSVGPAAELQSRAMVRIFLLIVGVFFLASCSGEPDWTDAERDNARFILLAFLEENQATQLTDSVSSPGLMPPGDTAQIVAHLEQALEYAQAVNDDVLDKLNSEIRNHWRTEFQEGIQLRLAKFREGDLQSEIIGHQLLVQFGDWWTANNKIIKFPKFRKTRLIRVST
jgi:hypothetical protein